MNHILGQRLQQEIAAIVPQLSAQLRQRFDARPVQVHVIVELEGMSAAGGTAGLGHALRCLSGVADMLEHTITAPPRPSGAG